MGELSGNRLQEVWATHGEVVWRITGATPEGRLLELTAGFQNAMHTSDRVLLEVKKSTSLWRWTVTEIDNEHGRSKVVGRGRSKFVATAVERAEAFCREFHLLPRRPQPADAPAKIPAPSPDAEDAEVSATLRRTAPEPPAAAQEEPQAQEQAPTEDEKPSVSELRAAWERTRQKVLEDYQLLAATAARMAERSASLAFHAIYAHDPSTQSLRVLIEAVQATEVSLTSTIADVTVAENRAKTAWRAYTAAVDAATPRE